MFINFDDLREGEAESFSVVLIGAGPAGITLAMELAERGIETLLVEAGGFGSPDTVGIDPYQGKSEPRPYPVLTSRLRFFGGTSGHWGGWCRPLDAVDFEHIPGIPYSGWPISRSEAYSHAAKAHAYLEIPSDDYDSAAALAAAGKSVLDLDSKSGFHTALFRFSPPTRFGSKYRSAIEKSNHVRCVLNTSLVRIQRGKQGRTQLLLRHADGSQKLISGKAHVLAMGGIENARMLLWSNVESARPLGGSGDWVGRCFMDHFGFTVAKVIAKDGMDYTKRETVQGQLMGRTVPNANRVLDGSSPSHMLACVPASAEQGLLQPEYGQNALLFGEQARNLQTYSVLAVSGHRPNRDSRVLLDHQTDSNGVGRVVVDWRIADEDWLILLGSIEQLGRALSRASAGRMRLLDFHPALPSDALSSGMHHIGTTRMAFHPSEGVVDPQCRVFDTEDLFVAGSSVFPTSGYANPTLTIVALALRLADHLSGLINKQLI